eukprot:9487399-Pyramimonas_sp.AAC.2
MPANQYARAARRWKDQEVGHQMLAPIEQHHNTRICTCALANTYKGPTRPNASNLGRRGLLEPACDARAFVSFSKLKSNSTLNKPCAFVRQANLTNAWEEQTEYVGKDMGDALALTIEWVLCLPVSSELWIRYLAGSTCV